MRKQNISYLPLKQRCSKTLWQAFGNMGLKGLSVRLIRCFSLLASAILTPDYPRIMKMSLDLRSISLPKNLVHQNLFVFKKIHQKSAKILLFSKISRMLKPRSGELGKS